MAGTTVMRLRVGDRFARCPYCGSFEFAAEDADAVAPPQELLCAQCGGHASRKLVLDLLHQAKERPARRPKN